MRFLAIGEAMLELSEQSPLWALNVAGDTFNTAWHVKRLLGDTAEVEYLSVLGTDPFSDRIARFMAASGIGTRFLRRDAVRGPGLYAISLQDGERSFTYWRDRSAARLLADDPEHLAAALGWAGTIYFSGITLAILTPEARARLLSALETAHAAGRRLIFDPNLRPRLWEDAPTMRATITRAAGLADVLLPSFEDEAQHFGDADLAACARRYGADAGRDVVVKNGGQDVLLAVDGARTLWPLDTVTPVDTTGAGDAFNAGWIAARHRGLDADASLAAAHDLARHVVSIQGALG